MTATAKKDWARSLTKTVKRTDTNADGETDALALWGRTGSTDATWELDPLEPVGPITITGEMADPGKGYTGTYQTISTVLYTYEDGVRMQTPYTKTVLILLAGTPSNWHLAGWRGNP